MILVRLTIKINGEWCKNSCMITVVDLWKYVYMIFEILAIILYLDL